MSGEILASEQERVFTGAMDKARIDSYAARITETKIALLGLGYTQVREDEFRNSRGVKLRFSYSHLEWRIHVTLPGRNPEFHSLHVREEPVTIPSPKVILFDIAELGKYANGSGSNGRLRR